jgi:hypothetical protein
MILRWTTLFWLVVVGTAVGAVFQIGAAVQALEAELAETQHRIHRDREAIHVLRAEWSYLNRPERVAALAEDLLGMVPLKAERISRIDALPPRPEDMEGRVFAGGPPVPPRRPEIVAIGAMPAGAPDSAAADPIGALVAATLAGAPPRQAAPAPVPAQPAPKIQPRRPAEAPRPINPVTGAPLPVGAHLVSETR